MTAPVILRILRPGAALLACILVLAAVPGGARAGGLPPDSPFPRSLADPREPGIRLTYVPDPDRFDAALGVPLPLARFDLGHQDLTLVLEAGAFFRLGKNGTFFPLHTFDGLIGLGLESEAGAFRGRLRVFHVSAHKADGDSTVSYRDQTFSRESIRLEGGFAGPSWFVFGGIGASWHAVPEDDGPHLIAGGAWEPRHGPWRPFASLYLLADAERGWRVNQSVIAGVCTGSHRVARFGLRYANGNRVEGQYWNVPERYLGLELQFSS